MNVRLPPLEHRIILWTTGEQGLVPEDVVKCDDSMNFVFSTKSGRFYELSGSIERAELLKLVGAIKDGGDTGGEGTHLRLRRPGPRGYAS